MKITTSKIIDASLAKHNMIEGYDPHRLNWDFINDREKLGDGVLEAEPLSRKCISLKPEWFAVLAAIDKLESVFAGRLSEVLHSVKGYQTCHFLDAKILAGSIAGRSMATIELSTGEWFSMIADQSAKTNFVFQGCFLEETSLDQCIEFASKFANYATIEAFLADQTLSF